MILSSQHLCSVFNLSVSPVILQQCPNCSGTKLDHSWCWPLEQLDRNIWLIPGVPWVFCHTLVQKRWGLFLKEISDNWYAGLLSYKNTSIIYKGDHSNLCSSPTTSLSIGCRSIYGHSHLESLDESNYSSLGLNGYDMGFFQCTGPYHCHLLQILSKAWVW